MIQRRNGGLKNIISFKNLYIYILYPIEEEGVFVSFAFFDT